MSIYDTIRFYCSGGRVDDVHQLYDLLRPQTCEGLRKLRFGNGSGDGGYVMVDDFTDIRTALSLGIGGDISWDVEMTQRGLEIYQYDHTVEPPPECAVNPKLHFHRWGIAGKADHARRLKTIEEILSDEMSGYSGDLVLKIDIDGYEWDAFSQMPDGVLRRFRQICIEIHNPLARPTQRAQRIRNLTVLKVLHQRFAPVHLHANNAGPVRELFGLKVPKLLEITYLRRDGQKFTDSQEAFPGELDVKNVSINPEIEIGTIVGLKTSLTRNAT